jgi:hypothetical protein
MLRTYFYTLTKKKMRKSIISLAVVAAVFATSTLFANGNTKNGDQSNQMSQTLNEFQKTSMEDAQIIDEVNNLLQENAKRHRYSSDFAFILVNDKIEKKYKSMNYQAYRYFKYDVDFSQIIKVKK